MQKTKEITPKKPKIFFRGYRAFIKFFMRKLTFYRVGEKIPESALILSNHEASKGPLSWELFFKDELRMMGNEEMNCTLKRAYRYQTRIYYHQKKGWPLWLARVVCLLVTPLTYCFYKGLQMISIRDGFALRRTVNDACKALFEYKEKVLIFPEDSSKGYFAELTCFKEGFLLICEKAYRMGHDLQVVVAYVKRKGSTCLIDEAVRYSQLVERYGTREKIAEALKNRCNEMGRLEHTSFKGYAEE